MEKKRTIAKPIFLLFRGGIFLLLILYFIGSSSLEILHQVAHDYQPELHSVQDESDPCHVTLHHPKNTGGCNHTSHVVEEDKCSVCDLQFHSNPILEDREITALTFSHGPIPSRLTHSTKGISFQCTGRAPPIS